MKYQLLILCSIVSSSLFSQSIVLESQNPESIPCYSDPSVTVFSFTNWSLYQTVDDTWSGEKYSGSCPSLAEETTVINTKYKVDLSTIDQEKALFLAYEGPQVELSKNNIYGLFGFYNPDQEIQVKLGDDCMNEMCSGLIIRSRYHDEMSSDTLVCNTFFPYTATNPYGNNVCFNSEKTDKNTIVSAIYKLTLDAPSNKLVDYGGIDVSELFTPTLINEPTIVVKEEFFDGTSYEVSPRELFDEGWGAYVVTHNVTGLPSETNQSFTEIEPGEFKSAPTTINLNIEYDILQFQKYSQLIGALVEGNEPERHPLNINFMMDQCITIVELIGTGGTNFKMAGGNLEFNDKMACIQVRDNSSIFIEEEQEVYLGRDGVGNVNLRSGGSIIVKKDADLIFGGNLILTPYRPYEGDETIHIDLQGGGHLEFTADAKIINNVFGDELFLYVYMNGGTIDLSKLTAEDRAKIILVYGESINEKTDLSYFPNPASDFIRVYNPKQGLIKNIRVFNLQGRQVYSKRVNEKNPTTELNLEELESGLYTIITEYNNELVFSKIVIE